MLLFIGKASGISILSTNQLIAQPNSNAITSDNPTLSETKKEQEKYISSSSDIFSQINNLVRSNQASVNEPQLSNSTSNEKSHNRDVTSSTPEGKVEGTCSRSKEASSIISAFPLLDFMRSPLLMIPAKSDNLKSNHIFLNNVSKDKSENDKVRDTNSIFTQDDVESNNCSLYDMNINGNVI